MAICKRKLYLSEVALNKIHISLFTSQETKHSPTFCSNGRKDLSVIWVAIETGISIVKQCSYKAQCHVTASLSDSNSCNPLLPLLSKDCESSPWNFLPASNKNFSGETGRKLEILGGSQAGCHGQLRLGKWRVIIISPKGFRRVTHRENNIAYQPWEAAIIGLRRWRGKTNTSP